MFSAKGKNKDMVLIKCRDEKDTVTVFKECVDRTGQGLKGCILGTWMWSGGRR